MESFNSIKDDCIKQGAEGTYINISQDIRSYTIPVLHHDNLSFHISITNATCEGICVSQGSLINTWLGGTARLQATARLQYLHCTL